MDQLQHDVRIMYAANRNLIYQLKQDLLKFGVKLSQDSSQNRVTIPGSLFKQLAPGLKDFPSINIHFFSDVYELVKVLPYEDAELIIVDERVETEAMFEEQVVDSSEHEEDVLHVALNKLDTSSQMEVRFENLQSALEKFTPHEFYYSMRRIVVVLAKETRKTDREFHLGIAQVRNVIVEPSSSIDLFLYSVRGLTKFYQSHSKTSLCFSGGGFEGYMYSLGVAWALNNCFANGKTCADFDIYSGVSSGAMMASSMAANIPVEELIKQSNRQGNYLEHISLNVLFDLATYEIIRKGFHLVKALSSQDLGEGISRFQDAIPVGFFRGVRMKQFIERQLKRIGLEDNLASLKKELYIGVTDQDTGEYILLGEEPWRDIKISQAVRASTALPPFYLPEKINGHWFNDGQIAGGSGLGHAIHKGARLVVNVDPMVAYTTNEPGAVMKRGGYFTILQAAKAVVQSRAHSLLKHSMDRNPDVDFINFHPTDKVMEAMAGNPMKYRIRTELVELGFKCTISQILDAYEAISHKFKKHGFVLKSKEDISQLPF